jgi:hypothetical protein
VVQGWGSPYYLDNIHDVFVRDDYVYVVSFYDSSLSIFKISEKSKDTSTQETIIETTETTETAVETTDNGDVSILRQWLRETIHIQYKLK